MAKPLFNFVLPESAPTTLSSESVMNMGAATPEPPLAWEGPIKFSIPKPPKPTVPKAELPEVLEGEDYLTAARRYVRANETSGLTYAEPYLDDKGNWTIGVGRLIPKGELWRYEGRTLTNKQIDDLFEEDFDTRLKVAKTELGKTFESLSPTLKVAVIDGFYRGDLAGSPFTLGLMKEGKWNDAAIEFLNNDEYRASLAKNRAGDPHGVAPRMERIAAAIAAEATKK